MVIRVYAHVLTFLGTCYTSQFVSYNFSSSQHTDSMDYLPSLGWWCNEGDGVIKGGDWCFSQCNCVVEFNGAGTLMFFDSKQFEHGTGEYIEVGSSVCRIGSVMTTRSDYVKMIKRI